MALSPQQKRNILRFILVPIIIINIIFILFIFDKDDVNTCSNGILHTLTVIFKWFNILHTLLLARIWILCMIKPIEQISWTLDDLITIRRFNILMSYRVLQVVQAFIGLFEMMALNMLYSNKDICSDDRRLIDFISTSFIPFIIISIETYFKLLYFIGLLFFAVVCPRCFLDRIERCLFPQTSLITDRLEQIVIELPDPNFPAKIFYGAQPECCICYEERCDILKCGHLICIHCQLQIRNLECPVCRCKMRVVESYRDYKERRDKLVNNTIETILTNIKY